MATYPLSHRQRVRRGGARRQSALRVRGRARARRRDDAGARAAVQSVRDDVRAAVRPRDGARAHLHADLRDAVRRPSDARHRARRARAARRRRRGHARDARRHHPGHAHGDVWTLQANAPQHRAGRGVARRARGDAGAREADVAPDPAAPPLWVDTGSEQLVDSARLAPMPCAAPRRARICCWRTAAPASARWRYVFAPRSAARRADGARRSSRDSSSRSTAPSSRIRAPARRAPISAAGCSPPAPRCRSGLPSRRATRSDGRAGSASRSPPTARSAFRAASSSSRAGGQAVANAPASDAVPRPLRPVTSCTRRDVTVRAIVLVRWNAFAHRSRFVRAPIALPRGRTDRRCADDRDAARAFSRRAGVRFERDARLRRRAAPARAHGLRPDRRRSPRLRGADARARRRQMLRETRSEARTPPPASAADTSPLRPPRKRQRARGRAQGVRPGAGARGPRASRLVDRGDAGHAARRSPSG